MSLIHCPPDIILTVTSFLNNKSNSCLMMTCYSMYVHGKTHGFLTSIKLDCSVDTMTFIRQFSQHSHSIRTVVINGIDDPHIFLPQYVENLVFDHCSIRKMDPGQLVPVTKRLKLTDYLRYKNHNSVFINWKYFPNLEDVELYVYDVNFEDLLKLKKLKHVKINTLTRGKYLFT